MTTVVEGRQSIGGGKVIDVRRPFDRRTELWRKLLLVGVRAVLLEHDEEPPVDLLDSGVRILATTQSTRSLGSASRGFRGQTV